MEQWEVFALSGGHRCNSRCISGEVHFCMVYASALHLVTVDEVRSAWERFITLQHVPVRVESVKETLEYGTPDEDLPTDYAMTIDGRLAPIDRSIRDNVTQAFVIAVRPRVDKETICLS